MKSRTDAVDVRHLSSRGRGRLLLRYAEEADADLLVMGAYGHGRMTHFLGLGGATAKVISGCRVPVLLAH
jgi:nucleotide-binding universal stress UspA family protein